MRKRQLYSAFFDLPIDTLTEITGKPRQTVLRWERDGWPAAYRQLAELHAQGRIMPLSWLGHCRFDLHSRTLHTESRALTVGEVLGIDYQMVLLAQMRDSLDRLQAENSDLRNRITQLANLNPDAASDQLSALQSR